MELISLIKKYVGKIIRITYKALHKYVKVDDKMVMFISFHGKGYSDNPKAIYEEMLKDERFKDYKFIWAIKNHKKKDIEIPGAQIIEYFSFKYFYYISKCKYWIFNCKMPEYVCKKDEQYYLQTWHGTPLKRLAYDIEVEEDTTFYRSKMTYEEMTHTYKVDVDRYNCMISPNKFCTKVFASAFRVDPSKLLESGYPRNDFLVNFTDEDVTEVREKYSIPSDKKVILYAPTWRDNNYNVSGYLFELKVDFKKWQEILGDEYVVLFKPHYLISNNMDLTGLEDFVINVPAADDISSLYIVSDILITDYSSVFFDYAILKRPIYFYMYDKKEYADQLRGFYLDIDKDLPSDYFEDEEAMLHSIKNNDYNYEKLLAFHNEFNEFEDGNASKKVINHIFDL